jgi:predicted DNA-binding mobile mystery protein A
MKKITRALRLRQLDKELAPYKELPRFKSGYIREIRDALGMSSPQLAKRMGMTHAAVLLMEHREAEETISLKTLNRAAEALDCELVYALVPKTSLAQTVRNQAQRKAIAQTKNIFRSMGLEQQSTDEEEKKELIDELTQELAQKGGRELWI